MEIHPTKEEFLELSGRGNVIPVYTDLMADFETPVSAYAKLRAHGPPISWSRWRGADPFAIQLYRMPPAQGLSPAAPNDRDPRSGRAPEVSRPRGPPHPD